MTDTTDDIAEEMSFQGFDDDCRLLQHLLNDVLHREVGSVFMEKVERTLTLAQVCPFFILYFSGIVFKLRIWCFSKVIVLCFLVLWEV